MTHHKLTLPEKNCEHCQKPFCWRRKWARDWDNVKYCSVRCKYAAKAATVNIAAIPPKNACAAASVEDEF